MTVALVYVLSVVCVLQSFVQKYCLILFIQWPLIYLYLSTYLTDYQHFVAISF